MANSESLEKTAMLLRLVLWMRLPILQEGVLLLGVAKSTALLIVELTISILLLNMIV